MSEQQAPTDEHLLHQFTRGDRAALGELAARYENALVGLAIGLLGGAGRADLAHDAVQESWVRVIRYAKSFNSQSTFKTWMFRIVINRCHDLRKTAAIKPPSPGSAEGSKRSGRADERAPSSSGKRTLEPHLRLTTAPTHDQVSTALESLPPRTRLVLLLCYHRGLTHPQAADVLDIPLGTLKSRLSAGLAELRETLAPREPAAPTPTAKAATP